MDDLIDGITGTIGGALSNPIVAGSVGAVGGAVVGGLVTAAVIKRKRKTTRKSRNSRKRNNRSMRKSRKQKQPYTAGKGKDRSRKRIRYTKNNQPYVLMANGKARFIKKSSVSRSRKLKGGRY